MSDFDRLLNFDENLEVWRVPSGEICVKFCDTHVKGAGVLIGTFGCGKDIYEASSDYMQKISGKTLVIEKYGHRREAVVL